MYFRQDKHKLILKCIKGGRDKNVSTCSIMNYKCVCIISFIFSKFRSTTQNHSFNCRRDFHALVETPCFATNPSNYFFCLRRWINKQTLENKESCNQNQEWNFLLLSIGAVLLFLQKVFSLKLFFPYIWYKKRSSFLVLGQRLFSCNVLKKLGISSPWDVQGGGGGVA